MVFGKITAIALCFFALVVLVSSKTHILKKKADKEALRSVKAEEEHWFTQLLDHENPLDNRTFQQRYFKEDKYWNKEAGPIYYYICGEGPCSKPGKTWFIMDLARNLNAKVYIVEHRFYGKTQPMPDWSLDSLKYLTVQQALSDMAYFISAKNIEHVKEYGEGVSRKWMTVGGSYAGSLSGLFRSKYPHLTVGALASSGVVHSILDYFQYDEQIRVSTNRSGELCPTMIHDLNLYIEDQIYNDPNGTGYQIKEMFNCTTLANDDFMSLIADCPAGFVQYGQRTQFCSGLMGLTTINEQLQYYIDQCQPSAADYDPYTLANTTIDPENAGRQWSYQTCSQLGWFQTPAPIYPLRSRVLSLPYWKNNCYLMFGEQLWPDTWRYNTEFGATLLQSTNVMYSNGVEDPWQWATKYESSVRDHYVEAFTRIADCNDCAHCQDLHRTPDPPNSPELEEIRDIETLLMLQWVYGDDPEVTYFPQYPPEQPNPPLIDVEVWGGPTPKSAQTL